MAGKLLKDQIIEDGNYLIVDGKAYPLRHVPTGVKGKTIKKVYVKDHLSCQKLKSALGYPAPPTVRKPLHDYVVVIQGAEDLEIAAFRTNGHDSAYDTSQSTVDTSSTAYSSAVDPNAEPGSNDSGYDLTYAGDADSGYDLSGSTQDSGF